MVESVSSMLNALIEPPALHCIITLTRLTDCLCHFMLSCPRVLFCIGSDIDTGTLVTPVKPQGSKYLSHTFFFDP